MGGVIPTWQLRRGLFSCDSSVAAGVQRANLSNDRRGFVFQFGLRQASFFFFFFFLTVSHLPGTEGEVLEQPSNPTSADQTKPKDLGHPKQAKENQPAITHSLY